MTESCRSARQSMWTAPGICPVSYSSTSSFDSTIRIPSSLRCFSSQSVSTSASGCAYCDGFVAIRPEISARSEAGASRILGASYLSCLCVDQRIEQFAVLEHVLFKSPFQDKASLRKNTRGRRVRRERKSRNTAQTKTVERPLAESRDG